MNRPADLRAPRRAIAVTTLLLLLFLVYSIAPLVWLLISSTKSLTDLHGTFGFSLAHWNLGSNISQTVSYDHHVFLRWLLNSVVYAGVGSAGATVISIAAGYGLAKFQFPGRGALFAATIGASLLPGTLLTLPLYLLFAKIGLIGSIWSLLIPYFVNPFCVYLGRVYAMAIPDEILEAARIDGAGEWRIFWSVSWRLMVTGAVTIFMLDFVGIWNNFLLPLFMLTDERTYPVTLGLYDWNLMVLRSSDMTSLVITGSLLAIFPLALFMFSMQRYWRGGILMGSFR